ncbi:hypothetical protein SHKM778_54130 [Streptomyces sp. KM77-8]|uniref:VOC domain-containing protein n=1 Tax=Streptomyces haneummycinicus TaxID=3074435 RepID=A0AAT9HNI8_9ACTN
MSVEFNHTIVLSRDREKSARFLAEILGLEVGEPTGMFLPVTTANGVTLDFATVDIDIPMQHYAFLVSEAEFDGILGRLVAARVPIQADPRGGSAGASTVTTVGGGVLHGSGRAWARGDHRRVRGGPRVAVERVDRGGSRGCVAGVGAHKGSPPPSFPVPNPGALPRTPAPRTPEGPGYGARTDQLSTVIAHDQPYGPGRMRRSSHATSVGGSR